MNLLHVPTTAELYDLNKPAQTNHDESVQCSIQTHYGRSARIVSATRYPKTVLRTQRRLMRGARYRLPPMQLS
jgi:hypothetical protein